jgi:hypothetical protein
VILDLIGWPLGLACAAIAVPLTVRTLRSPQQRGGRGNWITVLIFSAGAVACFAVAGLLSPLVAGVTGGLLLAVFALVAKPWQKGAGRDLRINAAFGKDWLVKDTLSVWGWLRARFGRRPDGGGKGGPVPLDAIPEYAAARAIPPVMDDPALGPVTEPGEIAAAGIPVPAPYAALAQFIGSFEPEDDMALRMFMDGHASGTIALADAWHAFADICLNGVGLSPAYVAGILEAGDSAGEHATLLAQVHKRFAVVYAAVKEWISAHGQLPHKAREFLTGED